MNERAPKFVNKFWDFTFRGSSARIIVQHKSEKDFFVLLDEFFVLFDEQNSTLQVRAPGSPYLYLKIAEMEQRKNYFDSLIGDILQIQQVYFSARRFVQVLGMKWKYGCLAREEMKLRKWLDVSKFKLPKVFHNIIVDLYPMNFDFLTGCKVGCLITDAEGSYEVRIEIDDVVFRFERAENHMAYPILSKNGNLEECTELTDLYKIAIGGEKHAKKKREVAVSEYNLRVAFVPPHDLRLTEFKKSSIYNLGYIP